MHQVRTDLSGAVAVITGAASGIGLALTRYAALELGMRVIMVDRAEQRLLASAQQLSQQGAEVSLHVIDITQCEALNELADSICQQYGAIKLLINNAVRLWV